MLYAEIPERNRQRSINILFRFPQQDAGGNPIIPETLRAIAGIVLGRRLRFNHARGPGPFGTRVISLMQLPETHRQNGVGRRHSRGLVIRTVDAPP